MAGLGFARDGAGSVVGWLLLVGGVLIVSVAPWLGRYRETALVVTADTMDAFLRRTLGAEPAPPEPAPRAPASSRAARRWQLVAVLCSVASLGVGIVHIAMEPDHPRSPAYHGVIWSHVAIENQLKVFSGANTDVVCNGGHDIRAEYVGQHVACHDSTRGDYTLVVDDPADQRYDVYGGRLPDPGSS